MPGIIVGVDGSAPSQRALEWAMKEAVIRHAPLTVLTVHQAVAGYYGGIAIYSEDPERTEQTRRAAQTETDKMLAGLSGRSPESVTVTAVHGFPADELIKAASDADMIVLGSRGAGGFTRLLMGSVASQVAQHAHCPVLIVPPRPDKRRRITVTDISQFTIGTEASCSDGAVGKVSRVIVDPLAEKVTHLVVESEHRREPDRLVPLDLVDGAAGEIRLHCTRAEFEKLEPAQETQFIAATSGYEGYGPDQVGYWPYYGLGGETLSHMVTSDTIPLGEVDVRRGEPVHATDGDTGRVQGLVIDPRSHHVTHVLLQEGHLWSRKEVAVPIGAVAGTVDGIRLMITKQEVQDLPAVDIDHPELT